MFGNFFKSIARRVLRALLLRGSRAAPGAGRKLGELLRDALPDFTEAQVATLLRSAANELDPGGP